MRGHPHAEKRGRDHVPEQPPPSERKQSAQAARHGDQRREPDRRQHLLPARTEEQQEDSRDDRQHVTHLLPAQRIQQTTGNQHQRDHQQAGREVVLQAEDAERGPVDGRGRRGQATPWPACGGVRGRRPWYAISGVAYSRLSPRMVWSRRIHSSAAADSTMAPARTISAMARSESIVIQSRQYGRGPEGGKSQSENGPGFRRCDVAP